MAKSSPPTLIILVLCSHIIFMHTSASDILLSSPHTTIKAQVGEELHITCLASKCRSKNPSFTWANLMDNTVAGSVNTVGQMSTLTMMVDIETDGTYRCSVSCDNPPVQKSFKILVYSFPSDPILQISSLVAGQQSHITCMVSNIYPHAALNFEILLDEKTVATFDYADQYMSSYEIQNMSLTHDLILENNMYGKEMKCVAIIEFPEMDIEPITRYSTQNLTLIFTPVAPTIKVYPSATLRVGEDIRLTCVSDSLYQAVEQWVKQIGDEEVEMPTNDYGTLVITNAQPEDSGVYICYSKNSAGKTPSRVEIDVQGLPEKPVLLLQPATTVVFGGYFTIECLASNNTNVTLWKISEDGDNYYLKSEVMIQGYAAPKDSAVYRCVAKNQYGASEVSETFTVEYPPMSTILQSSSVLVNESDPVTLTCVSDGVPTPNISIYKISESGESTLLSEDSEITISNVTSGIYQCQAENKLGTNWDKVQIFVEGTEDERTYNFEDTNVTEEERAPDSFAAKNTQVDFIPSPDVREGDFLRIWCSSISFPLPKRILKRRRGEEIIILESTGSSYDIAHVGLEDAGTYICETTNGEGQQVAERTLIVYAAPRNTHVAIFPSHVAAEGDLVQIRCLSEGYPDPELTLKRKIGNETISLDLTDGSYNITHVGSEDAGTYICKATNKEGQQVAEETLDVHGILKNTYIDIYPSPVAIEGGSVQIWCSSEGFTYSGITLKRRRGEETISLEATDGSYNITLVGTEDEGTYICEFTSEEGREVVEETLTVQIPPRNTTVVVTPSQNIREGDTVTITCETHSIPSPTIILQKVCAENSTVLQTNNGTFTLHNVTRNHTGTYTLNIFNSAGNETEEIHISVAERQHSPSFNPTSTVIFGSVALVSAGVIGSIIYHLKKSKLQGSYSLVKALRSKV